MDLVPHLFFIFYERDLIGLIICIHQENKVSCGNSLDRGIRLNADVEFEASQCYL